MFHWVVWVKAAARRMAAAYRAAASRQAMHPMLNVDDRLLRDIGLSRADVAECFSSPITRTSFDLLVAHGGNPGAVARLGYLEYPVRARVVYRDEIVANDSPPPGDSPAGRMAA